MGHRASSIPQLCLVGCVLLVYFTQTIIAFAFHSYCFYSVFFFFLKIPVCFHFTTTTNPPFRYHCHTLPPVSLRAVETVTQSKVLWIGTRVPSCQPTNCQVSGTLPTPTEGNTATTTLRHTHNKVFHHRVRDSCRKRFMELTVVT